MKDPAEKKQDEEYMKIAFEEANAAAAEDEVPIGAVIVRNGKIIARCHNRRESDKIATHHAEILAIQKACQALGGWRLPDTTLYVSLEPCPMCAGAIINARIPRVVFAAHDKRFGAMGSLTNLSELPFNHKPEVESGVLGEEGAEILTNYFKKKRQKPKCE